MSNRFQHLVDACRTPEQMAELALMLGAHATLLAMSSSHNAPSEVFDPGAVLRDAHDGIDQLHRKTAACISRSKGN